MNTDDKRNRTIWFIVAGMVAALAIWALWDYGKEALNNDRLEKNRLMRLLERECGTKYEEIETKKLESE